MNTYSNLDQILEILQASSKEVSTINLVEGTKPDWFFRKADELNEVIVARDSSFIQHSNNPSIQMREKLSEKRKAATTNKPTLLK